MRIIFITLLAITGFYSISIYSFSVNSIDNQPINLNDFRGKKILLVNIATSSSYISQLTQLEQLYQQFQDSLIIIGFPSNSFNNESRTNEEIQQFCTGNYNVSFVIASKGAVTGEQIQPIFNWLTHVSENGILEGEIKDDFQKYLIDGNGDLLGVFSGSTPSDDASIIQAIQGN